MDDALHAYATDKSTVPGPVCQEIAAHTREREPLARMLCGELVASFLTFLIRSCGVHRILEIGTFTGYSTLAMAEALPERGRVITVDIAPKEEFNAFWNKSPHGRKITQIAGPALEVLPTLTAPYELVFIDADKANYPNYLEAVLPLLSARGVVVADNVLWSGRVLEEEGDADTRGIKEFNDRIAADPAWHSTLLPVRDGLMVITRA